MDFYIFVDQMKTVYNLLQDDLSRSIFWARLQFDVEPTMSRAIQLLKYAEGYSDKEICAMKDWTSKITKIENKEANLPELLLYGAGAFGRLVAGLIQQEGGDFFAFCDQRAEEVDTELYVDGKRVYPPSYLFEHMERCYVLIATTDHFLEIEQLLLILALSVYHRQGDVLSIMNRLHSLVPEYRFWLRHYGPLAHETVLYASV